MLPTITITSDQAPGRAPIVLVRPSLLAPRHLEVSSEGELVVIQVGNSTMRIHYEDALKISQWIRLRAKEAKNRAGDRSRHWSAIGILENLEHG